MYIFYSCFIVAICYAFTGYFSNMTYDVWIYIYGTDDFLQTRCIVMCLMLCMP